MWQCWSQDHCLQPRIQKISHQAQPCSGRFCIKPEETGFEPKTWGFFALLIISVIRSCFWTGKEGFSLSPVNPILWFLVIWHLGGKKWLFSGRLSLPLIFSATLPYSPCMEYRFLAIWAPAGLHNSFSRERWKRALHWKVDEDEPTSSLLAQHARSHPGGKGHTKQGKKEIPR